MLSWKDVVLNTKTDWKATVILKFKFRKPNKFRRTQGQSTLKTMGTHWGPMGFYTKGFKLHSAVL